MATKPAEKAQKKPAKGFPKGSNMKTEHKEEKVHQDLDGDGEKGEPAAHKKKVFGKALSKKKDDKSGKSGKKMCAACTKAGKSSCSHL
jgi:hypothetical protein